MRKKLDTQRYDFALLAVVGLVALLAVVLIVSTFSPGSWVSENLRGQATNVPEGSIEHAGELYELVEFQLSIPETISGDLTITLTSLTTTSAILAWTQGTDSGNVMFNLGDSHTLGDHVATLYALGDPPEFTFAPTSDEICNLNGQNAVCRGGSACCGGTCMELPSCDSVQEGPIATCGTRQMYCCGGALTFVACGGMNS